MTSPRKPTAAPPRPRSAARRGARRRSSRGRDSHPPSESEPRRFGAVDEEFWRTQESRLSGQLGQPCCTLSGMCTLLGGMTGDFAVIIHGEADCGNSFVHHRMVSAERFFCTRLSEDQITSGRVDEPLERCLRLVLQELSPEVVIVLGTCPVTMIGADPGQVVERVSASTEIPVLMLHTGGLKLSTQAQMVDWLYSSLAGLPQLELGEVDWRRRAASSLGGTVARLLGDDHISPDDVRASVESSLAPADIPMSVNLIGLPQDGVRSSELEQVLRQVGVAVGGLFPFGADLQAWRKISHAGLSVVADRRLYPRLMGRLEQSYSLPTVEVPLPIGLGQSLRFYRAIGEFFGVQQKLDEELAPLVERARAHLERFRSRAGKVRVAMGIRMLNNYQADQLAYEGLGDVEALAELGFDLTLLVQGPPEERPRFEKMLSSLGVDLPLRVFPSPWNLAPLLREGDYHVAYLADHGFEEAQKAELPMIKSRGLAPLLAGVEPNLNVLAELLMAASRKRGRRS